MSGNEKRRMFVMRSPFTSASGRPSFKKNHRKAQKPRFSARPKFSRNASIGKWLLEHQTALQKNEAALTAKLREAEVTLEERRLALDKEYQRRDGGLAESFAATEKNLRQELAEKEEVLRQHYQVQLAENIGQND